MMLKKTLMKQMEKDRPGNFQIQPDKKTELLLTVREKEILRCIVFGMSDIEIARKLSMSSDTVNAHVHCIFKKIGAPNHLQAALWAGMHL